MIEIFGPTYKYSGEKLDQPEIIYVLDHHYDEDDQCFHIKTLIDNSICDPQQHLVVFNQSRHEDQLQNYNTLSLPMFMANESQLFRQQQIQPNWQHKIKAFNFMINKPRLHREFLLILIEYFELTNYSHTLAWNTINLNRDTLKSLTNNALYRNVIETTQVNIPTNMYKLGKEIQLDQGLLNGNTKNALIYQKLLQASVFEPSCISLITEPVFFQKETVHTEKTIMAMYAGTLPIWVGGWALADEMRNLGFDVFDDLVDHSYERMPDPFDRCYHAVERNLDLLRNPEQVKKFIDKNQHRFEHNVKLIENNVFLTRCIDQINQYTNESRKQLCSLISQLTGQSVENYRAQHNYKLYGSIPQGAMT